MDDKKYEIPDEICDDAIEERALLELRDKYVLRPFGFKNARRCAVQSRQKQVIYLRKIYELYPELRECKFTFNFRDKSLMVTGVVKEGE